MSTDEYAPAPSTPMEQRKQDQVLQYLDLPSMSDPWFTTAAIHEKE
jgi:hypothetical protein